MLPQINKNSKKASDRQSKQSAITTSIIPVTNTFTTTATNTSTDNEKQNRSTYQNRPICAIYGRKYLDIYFGKNWNPYTNK
jgi:hypothetical protein